MDETSLILWILSASIVLQLSAAVLAIRLIKITGHQVAWMMIATAIFLMAVRRSMSLFHLASDIALPNLDAELVALMISGLMALGIALIRPLFHSIQHTKKSVETRERSLMSMAQNASDGILVCVEGQVVFTNNRTEEILGRSHSELLGMGSEQLLSLFWTAKPEQDEAPHEKALFSGLCETRVRQQGGRLIPVELVGAGVQWQGQEAQMLTFRDITSRKNSEAKMRMLSGALEQTGDSVFITDAKGVIEYINPAFERITGFSRSDAIGQNPRILNSGRQDDAFYESMWDKLIKGQIYRGIFVNLTKAGQFFYEEKTIAPVKDEDGAISHYISTGRDVTERTQTQERIKYLAYHDVLTGLANRALFSERLLHAIRRSRNARDRLAVFFLDLDRFKTINDTLGHELGDKLLQAIAAQLKKCVRTGDTIARLGGDEFAILLEDSSSQDDVSYIANKVLSVLAEPTLLMQHELVVTVSIGIALFPEDGQDADTLLKNADTAMYRAKEQGRNTYTFYMSEMGEMAFDRLMLENQLRHALEKKAFVLHYQPQIDLRSRRITGYEALIRWQHEDKPLMLPTSFIPILEETGLIVDVGIWVLKTACAQAKRWQETGGDMASISVNLSGRQFRDRSLIQKIKKILETTKLSPKSLTIEITESILIHDIDGAIQTINTLRAMGVRIAIDDFGTGHSSFSYLKRFKVDELKIDQSFVSDIPSNTEESSLVESIVEMAHHLNMSVIAEGVENNDQLNFLEDCACETAQGFYFSRPLIPEQVPSFIERFSSHEAPPTPVKPLKATTGFDLR